MLRTEPLCLTENVKNISCLYSHYLYVINSIFCDTINVTQLLLFYLFFCAVLNVCTCALYVVSCLSSYFVRVHFTATLCNVLSCRPIVLSTGVLQELCHMNHTLYPLYVSEMPVKLT